MIELSRIDLPTSRKVQLAASALGQQGQHGSATALARSFGVARGTVYSARKAAREALTTHFDNDELIGRSNLSAPLSIVVHDAQIRRTVAALRVLLPGTLRPIKEVLSIIYPGLHLSYGTIQAMACDAERRAAEFNAGADLSEIATGALDELFSQGRPVLGGIDLESGYAFCLALRESRGTADWAEVLEVAQRQGLDLDVAIKDAAPGIAAGVTMTFPECEHRDDCFHAKYEVGHVQRRFEQKAYNAIARADEARWKLDEARRKKQDLRQASMQLRWAESKCVDAIALHDAFECSAKEAEEAQEFVDLVTGRIRTGGEAQQMLQSAARAMMALEEPNALKVGRYLLNRSPGLLRANAELEEELHGLGRLVGEDQVNLASVIARLLHQLDQPRWCWRRVEHARLLTAAYGLLRRALNERADGVINAVRNFVQRRHRASSVIEGLNSALRPHLYLQRGVSQGFLELFRACFNLRSRRSGPYKGMSPYERLTGSPVHDWLGLIGLPLTVP
jgi:hypothetical protein